MLAIHTKRAQDCIEARLCGFGLITTVEKLDPGFANASDQIAMQINIRNVAAGDDFSVGKLEVFVVFDCSDHLGFDLTHEKVKRKDWEEVGGRSLPLMWP